MESVSSEVKKQIEEDLRNGAGPKVARYALACLSGLIPLIGGAVGGIGGAWSETEQERLNKLLATWLKLQEDEIREIGQTLVEVYIRLDNNDDNIRKRIESSEYLSLVKKCFRDWSAAESEEKRKIIRNLLVNAASTNIAGDDIIRLFIEWVDMYSEAHFKVVATLYNNAGLTRAIIWNRIHGNAVREDSAEADLSKLIITDLSMGHIIRQHREVDYSGNFVKPGRRGRSMSSSSYYTSAFDDEKQYELTSLGQQFVHYTMNEVVPKIEYRPEK